MLVTPSEVRTGAIDTHNIAGASLRPYLCQWLIPAPENQQHRTNGLSLVIAAIVLWNTVYLEKAIQKLKRVRGNPSEELLTHLSPLGWEHINLTGDYVWRPDAGVRKRRLRPLRLETQRYVP
jgi:hypothetical protein